MKRTERKRGTTGQRVRHIIWIVLRDFGILVSVLSVLLLLSLNLAPARRFVVKQIDGALASVFAGQVVIEKLDHVGVTGVRGLRMHVDDPSGTRVLFIDGANVRVSLFSTLRSLLFGKGDSVIDLSAVQLDYIDANLDADPSGNLLLLGAFEPKNAKPSDPNARKTDIDIKHLGLKHAWVHGQPSATAPYVDADLDRLSTSVIIGSRQVVDLSNLELTSRGLPPSAQSHIVLKADFQAPAKSGQERAGHVDIHGDIGGIPLEAKGSLEGPQVQGTVDVARVTPEMVAALAPTADLTEDLSMHAEVHGLLTDLEATVAAKLGQGSVDIKAHVSGSDTKVVHATLAARNIDLHAASATAPPSALGVDASVDVTSHAEGAIEGKYAFNLLPGAISANAVPPAHLAGTIQGTGGPAKELSVTGAGGVEEPGVQASLDFKVRQKNNVSTAAFELSTSVARLDKTRLGSAFHGAIDLGVLGTVVAGSTTTVDVSTTLKATGIAHEDQHVDRARLLAKVKGSTTDPLIDVDLQTWGLAAGTTRFARTTLGAHGSLRHSEVKFALVPIDAPRVDGSATIEKTDAATRVRDAVVSLSRDDAKAVVRLRDFSMRAGEMRIDGLTVDGLGDPLQADVRKTDRELVVKATTSDLDLSRIARLLRSTEVQAGHVSMDVALSLQTAAARGHVRLGLAGGQFARMKNSGGSVEATLEGRTIDAVIHANLGENGNIDIDKCHIELDGRGALQAASWQKARGQLALETRLDLARIRRFLPKGSIPLTDLEGILQLKGEVARASSADPIPDLHMTVETHGLVMSGRKQGERVDGARVFDRPPWRVEDVDVQLETKLTGRTGDSEMNAKLSDRHGMLASFDVRAGSVPYRDWLRRKSMSVESLAALRVGAHLAVPRRDLKQLPAMLKAQQYEGDIAANVDFDGALADPDVRFSLEALHFASPISGTKPLDAKIDGQYDNGDTKVNLAVTSAERKLLDGELHFSAKAGDLLQRSRSGEFAWRASTRMKLDEFPLETVGLFSDFQMKGFASGELTIDDVHRDARAKLQIALRDLQLGRAKFAKGSVAVDFDGHLLHATTQLNQADGFVQTEAQLGMSWGRETAPTPNTDVPAFATLRASKFRAAALLPFVSGAVSELDGKIDADARIDMNAGGGSPSMKGTVNFSDGLVQLARAGEPLHGVTMKIGITPDGVIRLDDFSAHGSTGTMTAKALARLNGFNLVGATGELHIPRRDPLPLDLDGQDMGDIDGDISMKMDRSPQGDTNVAIDIPRLHTLLPLSSSHHAQELGEAKQVRVGYFRRPTQFILLPRDAGDLKESDDAPEPAKPSGRTIIAVHLGKDVEIKRGTTLRVLLEGDPKIELADETRMSGQIRLTRGTLEVQGKRFEIEKGTVTFVGDEPSNPQIMITAGWTAADGTRVYADFTGPLKTGKVKLRSEPPRPQNEVLALIMFGTAEGSSSTPYASPQPDGATRAGAAAGSFATEGLSKGLDELTGLEVSTKIDTSNSANPKPEIEVQVARDISLQIGYILGTPPPGTNPDKTLFTVDWRFKRNWSLEGTFGDQGSSILDFLWRYRY